MNTENASGFNLVTHAGWWEIQDNEGNELARSSESADDAVRKALAACAKKEIEFEKSELRADLRTRSR